MSRLGKLPITVPNGTQVNLSNGFIIVKGPKGELKQKLDSKVKIEINDNEIIVSVLEKENKEHKAVWGLFRALINNMVVGVNTGFEKKLEIKGVGYKASVAGNNLNLSLGFSHPVVFPLPAGISALVEGNTITISGFDKQLVGELSAQIRKLRKPEPYKGKGIRYSDEVIRRKAGKTASK